MGPAARRSPAPFTWASIAPSAVHLIECGLSRPCDGGRDLERNIAAASSGDRLTLVQHSITCIVFRTSLRRHDSTSSPRLAFDGPCGKCLFKLSVYTRVLH